MPAGEVTCCLVGVKGNFSDDFLNVLAVIDVLVGCPVGLFRGGLGFHVVQLQGKHMFSKLPFKDDVVEFLLLEGQVCVENVLSLLGERMLDIHLESTQKEGLQDLVELLHHRFLLLSVQPAVLAGSNVGNIKPGDELGADVKLTNQ